MRDSPTTFEVRGEISGGGAFTALARMLLDLAERDSRESSVDSPTAVPQNERTAEVLKTPRRS